jgi:cell division septation protein DedD
MTDAGEKFLAGKDRFASGNYSFTLLNNRTYEISARKPGYEPGTASLNTSGIRPNEKGYSTPIFLKKVSRAAPPQFAPALQTAANSRGEAYRIQVSAVRNYDAMRFASLEEIGQLLTEEIPGKDLVRVMIGDFPSLTEAQQYQEKVAKKGFKGTIIVLYENGKRVRTID